MSDRQRDELLNILSNLPYQYGYTLAENKDGSLSLAISGKPGHTNVRAKMHTRGDLAILMADARDFVQFAASRKDK